ncbi:MAG: peptidyl-prolyl cis-trans isomerase [Phycisphaeraceae bacterium]|nr:peptidyl-prolyl cis-trans isomerase [Phycisphaeraceae bacterium]MBX3408800.1 peptidyl-prolyl cis-trans isomerase [Phycisphaeraceae bacterium]
MLVVAAAGFQPETKPADPPAAPKAAEPPATPAPDAEQQEKLVFVNLTTSMGDILLELNNEKAPISVKNFLNYTKKGHYDGTIFHRVINNFMIQGGGFTPDMRQKPTDEPIQNEWQNGLKNTKYTVAMARLGDGRPNPNTVNSATAQFFINVKDNDFLDRPQPDGGAYAVFGRVVAGISVVDAIKAVQTTVKGPHQDVPAQPVTITKAVQVSKEDAEKILSGEKK